MRWFSCSVSTRSHNDTKGQQEVFSRMERCHGISRFTVVKDFPAGEEWVCDIELLDTSTKEQVLLLARFYADEYEYQMLKDEWPELKLLPRDVPPFNRDCRMPRPRKEIE